MITPYKDLAAGNNLGRYIVPLGTVRPFDDLDGVVGAGGKLDRSSVVR